jgi:hypothetical protein
MAKTITRWDLAASAVLGPATRPAIEARMAEGVTDGLSTLVYGPTDTVPANQYICERIWTTVEAAQNWLDSVDAIAQPYGFVCLEKILVE